MKLGNERAFPGITVDQFTNYHGGLSKREYFAAMALQGMMSLPPNDLMDFCGGASTRSCVGEWVAKNCIDAADALLAELAKEQK